MLPLVASPVVISRAFCAGSRWVSASAALAASSLLLACAIVPMPPPEPDGAILAASVKIDPPLSISLTDRYATALYFVRIEADQPVDNQTRLLESNYVAEPDVFLVNARPGRYALVAAGLGTTSSVPPVMTPVGGGVSVGVGMSVTKTLMVYFPSELIERTIVEVGPGEVAFIAEIALEVEGMDGADPTQSHYYRLVDPEHSDQSGFAKSLDTAKHYRGIEATVIPAEEAHGRFVNRSQDALRQAGWPSALVIRHVSAPPRE